MQGARDIFDELWDTMHGPSSAEQPALIHDATQDLNDSQSVKPPSPTPGTACPNVAAHLKIASLETLE